MIRIRKSLIVGATTLGVLAIPTSALATTVTAPCGCTFADTSTGNAATTPAAGNPSGTVGNGDNSNRTYMFGEDPKYPSAYVNFSG